MSNGTIARIAKRGPVARDRVKENASAALYRERNKEAIRERARIWREEHREELRAYMRAYSQEPANKAKIKQSGKRSRDRYPERVKERNRVYQKTHRKQTTAKTVRYQKRNKDKVKEATRRRREQDPSRCAAISKRYRERNKEKIRARKSVHAANYKFKRRTRAAAAGGIFTHKEILQLFDRQGGKCATCKTKIAHRGSLRYHTDHVMPVALGGSNWIENIQLLCPKCNTRKKAKHPDEWAKENGLLFC